MHPNAYAVKDIFIFHPLSYCLLRRHLAGGIGDGSAGSPGGAAQSPSSLAPVEFPETLLSLAASAPPVV